MIVMNVKQLRDYLNSLDLDSIQSNVNVVSVIEDGKTMQVDDFGGIILVTPGRGFKPYLSIYTSEAVDVCNAE